VAHVLHRNDTEPSEADAEDDADEEIDGKELGG
jgi:hypothetical protein